MTDPKPTTKPVDNAEKVVTPPTGGTVAATKEALAAAATKEAPDVAAAAEKQKQLDEEEAALKAKVEAELNVEPDKTPDPTEADLDAVYKSDAASFLETDQGKSLLLHKKLVDAFPDSTPGSHSLYGYGGVVIKLQDVRDLVADMD